jgi:peptidoglycan/LPS O-acetylase OafA/YrhL
MQFQISDTPLQNVLFAAFYIAALLLTIKRAHYKGFDKSLTTQLKGYAILSVVFSHIGYFLSTDDRFLWPFSISAGVGVNMFLFLSGFGLTASQFKNPLSIVQFYRKRLLRLFIPMWIIVFSFVCLDFVVLHQTYPVRTLIQSVLGYFPRADLFSSLNAPLWYFTVILFYYLAFSLMLKRKLLVIAPLVLVGVGYYLSNYVVEEHVTEGVMNMYKVHFLAFPLGMSTALIIGNTSLDTFIQQTSKFFGDSLFLRVIKITTLVIFAAFFAYYSIHSGVGESKDIEHSISLFLMMLFIGIVWLIPIRSKVLELFGIYSYEIYLFHWPLLYRYDFLYKYLPASIATVLYLALFLVVGYVLQRLIDPQKRTFKILSS